VGRFDDERGRRTSAVRRPGLRAPAVLVLALTLLPVPTVLASAAPVAPAKADATSATAVAIPDLAPEPDLATLQTDLDAARAEVATATAAALEAAGRTVNAQIAVEAARGDADRARAQLRGDVRRTLTDGPLTSVPDWVVSPDPAGAELLSTMRRRAVVRQADRVMQLRDALRHLDDAGLALDAQRTEATRQAANASLAADRARRLLDAGLRTAASNTAIRAQLAERKRALDALNAALVQALAPVQRSVAVAGPPDSSGGPRLQAVDAFPDGTRPNASSAAQAAVLQLLEKTPMGGMPAGYQSTGQVFNGLSSWYGPGFVGSPTSTGVPYDPEKLTCAMLMVPLGTVVRVTTTAGRSVVLLVNDHGPYVGPRILDVSMRANRILGLGLGQVRIEVLRPTG
jgi:rare lipoprotein A